MIFPVMKYLIFIFKIYKYNEASSLVKLLVLSKKKYEPRPADGTVIWSDILSFYLFIFSIMSDGNNYLDN